MTFEEKMTAIDRYFDNITSEKFNELLESKYGIPKEVEIVNEGDFFPEDSDVSGCFLLDTSFFSYREDDSEIESTSSEDYAKAA